MTDPVLSEELQRRLRDAGISYAELRAAIKPLVLYMYDKNITSMRVTREGTLAELSLIVGGVPISLSRLN